MNPTRRKLDFYNFCYAHRRMIWTLWLLGLAVVAGSWLTVFSPRIAALHKPWLMRGATAVAIVGLAALALSLPAFLFSGLFNVRFRYIARWAAHTAGTVRSSLSSGWPRFLLEFTVVTLIAWLFYRLTNKAFHSSQLFDPPLLLKLIVITLLLRILFWASRTSSRLVILEFSNLGNDTLKVSAQGIATRLLSQLTSLVQLFSGIDEIAPKRGNDQDDNGGAILKATVQVQDVGGALQGVISGDSKVKIWGGFEIPLGALVAAVGRLVQGPRIIGSLHKDGSGTTLIASLVGGGLSRNWRVLSSDLEDPCAADDVVLQAMIEQLAYRIFTDLVKTGSRRWRAVRAHCQGLRCYRDQLNTQRNRKLNLKRSERAFIQALSEDNEFAQNHYNLGVVYQDLGSPGAETEFQQAADLQPDFAAAHYALAKEQSDKYERARLCDRVILLQPDHIEAWLLKGVPPRRHGPRKPIDPNEWSQVVQPRAMAAALSWKALCRAEWDGSALENPETLAYRCLLDLGTARAGAGEAVGFSAAIFAQAISLNDTNPRALVQLASTYKKAGQLSKAAGAYFDVLRLQGPTTRSLTPLATVLIELCKNSGNDADAQRCKQQAEQVYRLANERSVLNERLLNDLALSIGVQPPDQPADSAEAAAGESVEESKQAKADEDLNAEEAVERALHYVKDATRAEKNGNRRLADQNFRKAEDLISWRATHELREQNAYGQLADELEKGSNFQRPLFYAKSAVELDPLDQNARQRLARIYYNLRDYNRAETEWQIALDLEPEDVDALQGITETYWERGAWTCDAKERSKQFDRVIEIFNQTLELSEKERDIQARTHYWLGRFYNDQRRYDNAIYHFNIAKRMDFSPLATRLFLGETYLEIESWDNAEDEFRDARQWQLEQLKQSRRAQKTRRGASRKNSDSQGPQEEVESPIELWIQIHLCRAMMYAERRVNLTEGRRLARRATSLITRADKSRQNQLRSWQYECLGAIKLEKGDLDGAIKDLETAIALSSDGLIEEGSGYYRLAKAHLACARSTLFNPAQSLLLARERCDDAEKASLRGVYKDKIDRLRKEIDFFAPKPDTAQLVSQAAGGKAA